MSLSHNHSSTNPRGSKNFSIELNALDIELDVTKVEVFLSNKNFHMLMFCCSLFQLLFSFIIINFTLFQSQFYSAITQEYCYLNRLCLSMDNDVLAVSLLIAGAGCLIIPSIIYNYGRGIVSYLIIFILVNVTIIVPVFLYHKLQFNENIQKIFELFIISFFINSCAFFFNASFLFYK